MILNDASTRDDLRRSYAEALEKSEAGLPLTPLDALLASVIDRHPEYASLLRDPELVKHSAAESSGAGHNPFLHMGLHVAVREQVSIDKPPGIRAILHRLNSRFGDEHRAEHALMDALAETLWDAQRSGHAPDEQQYLDRAMRMAGENGPR